VIATLAIACAGSDEPATTASPAATCEAQVSAYLDRVAECRDITPEQQQQALDRCSAGPPPIPGAIRSDWRPEFQTEVEACTATLSCEQFVEDADDICFPIALSRLASKLLTPATISACIEGGTDDCEVHLATGQETSDNVVAACFRRWSTCIPELPNSEPYWTEDHCGMLIALTDEGRATAMPCLETPCTQVAACLVSAGSGGF
jgi:hypothetical protein